MNKLMINTRHSSLVRRIYGASFWSFCHFVLSKWTVGFLCLITRI